MKPLLFVRVLMPFSLFSNSVVKQHLVIVWDYFTSMQWRLFFLGIDGSMFGQFHGDFESWLKNRGPLVSRVRF